MADTSVARWAGRRGDGGLPRPSSRASPPWNFPESRKKSERPRRKGAAAGSRDEGSRATRREDTPEGVYRRRRGDHARLAAGTRRGEGGCRADEEGVFETEMGRAPSKKKWKALALVYHRRSQTPNERFACEGHPSVPDGLTSTNGRKSPDTRGCEDTTHLDSGRAGCALFSNVSSSRFFPGVQPGLDLTFPIFRMGKQSRSHPRPCKRGTRQTQTPRRTWKK